MGIIERLENGQRERMRTMLREDAPAFPGRRAPGDPFHQPVQYRPVERGLTLQDVHGLVVQHEDVAYAQGWADALRDQEERIMDAVQEAQKELARAVVAELMDSDDMPDVAAQLDRLADSL